jgi:hypothetical protein
MVAELRKIQFINWIDGLGSVGLMPLLMRRIRTGWFLDLLFGRIRLLFYLDAPRFLSVCEKAGLEAGFLSRKHTNRLRSQQGWRPDDYPLFKGRALAYIVGEHPTVIGSLRLHQMVFNWQRPSSVAAEVSDCVAQVGGGTQTWGSISDLNERDLEH